MERAKIVQALQALLQLENEDLNKEAEELGIRIEKDMEELKNLEADFIKFGNEAKHREKQIDEEVKKDMERVENFIKEINNSDIPSSKKVQIANTTMKKASEVNKIFKHFYNMQNELKLLKLEKSTHIPREIFKSYDILDLEDRLFRWYRDLAIGAAGFIPIVGYAFSSLGILKTLIDKPLILPDFNTAVQIVGRLFVADIASSFHHDFFIPKAKLDFKDLKVRIEAFLKLEEEKMSSIKNNVEEMISSF